MVVRFAFIGAGGIASRHLSHLESHDDAAVVAVCDIDEDVAETAAAPHDAAVYTDHHDLYEDATFDAVVVAIPPFAHEDQERLAAEYGVDLFVEKPLALDVETARENARAVEAGDVVSQVGHMNRYADSVERAKEIVEDRTLALVDGHWWSGVPGDDDHWWRRREYSGGQVVEQATHTYDLVRYFAGDVETVHAVGGHRVNVEEVDFEDSTSVSMIHENDVVSHVSATSVSPTVNRGLALVGDGFALEIDPEEDRLTGTVDGEDVDFQGSGGSYGAEMDSFVEAVRTRDQSLCRSPYADALETFETTLAVERALDSGEPEAVGR